MAGEEEPIVPEPRANPYLIGHDAAERAYLGAWASGRLAHAWMICGLRESERSAIPFRMVERPVASARERQILQAA